MKNILRFTASAIGVFALITGTSSCKKDDPTECCTMTYTYDGVKETSKLCEDGTGDYNWKEDGDFTSWSDIKTYGNAIALLSEDITFTCSK